MEAALDVEAPLAPCGPPRESPCEAAAEEGLLAQSPSQGAAFGVESDDGSSSAGPADEPAPQSCGRPLLRPRSLAAGAVGAVLLLGCVAAGLGHWRSHSMEEGDVHESVELSAVNSMFNVLETMSDAVHQTSELTDNVHESYKSMVDMSESFQNTSKKFQGLGGKLMEEMTKGPKARKKLLAKFRALNATQKAKVKARIFKRFNITSWKQLRPKVHMHDGNYCLNDEEEFQSLCYKKCSILTDGHFPFRVSAWECCQHPGVCGTAYKINFKLCGGYGVAGSQVGGGCPHTKGGCLKSEELYGNMCYKKCMLLTYGVLSLRSGPMTCCKASAVGGHFWDFLDYENCDTKDQYYQGGGDGDGDSGTPNQPHLPMESLVEA